MTVCRSIPDDRLRLRLVGSVRLSLRHGELPSRVQRGFDHGIAGRRQDIGGIRGGSRDGVHHAMRLHAPITDGLSIGSIELGRSQPHADARRGQREDALHRALAVAAFSHDRAPRVIADGARKDLAGAGRIVVDQDDQGHPPGAGSMRRNNRSLRVSCDHGWRRLCRPQ